MTDRTTDPVQYLPRRRRRPARRGWRGCPVCTATSRGRRQVLRDRAATTPTTAASAAAGITLARAPGRRRRRSGGSRCPTATATSTCRVAAGRRRARPRPRARRDRRADARRRAATAPCAPSAGSGPPAACTRLRRATATRSSPRRPRPRHAWPRSGRSTEIVAWTEAAVHPHDGASDELLAAAGRRGSPTTGWSPPRPASRPSSTGCCARRARTAAAAGKKGSSGAALDGLPRARRSTGSPPRTCGCAATSPTPCTSCGWRRAGCAARCRRYRPLLDRRAHRAPRRRRCASWAAHSPPPATPRCCASGSCGGLADLPPELRLGRARGVSDPALRPHRGGGAARPCSPTLDGHRYARAARRGSTHLLDEPPLRKRADAPGAQGSCPAHVARQARRGSPGASTWRSIEQPVRSSATRRARGAQGRQAAAVRHEVARPAVGKPAKRTRSGSRSSSTALGEHQDTVVARGTRCASLGARRTASGENGFALRGAARPRRRRAPPRIETPSCPSCGRRRREKLRRWLALMIRVLTPATMACATIVT